MKFLWVLTLTFLLCLGCGESEQPLDENDEFAVAGANAFAPEVETVILRGLSDEELFYDRFRSLDDEDKLVILPDEDTPLVTNVGVPTVVYRVIAGQLTKGAVVFQKEIYHLHVFWMGDETVLVNILEQQIPYISQEDAWEHLEDFCDQRTNPRQKDIR